MNGSTNEKYGIARSVSVMPGDKINAEVYAKFVDTNSSNWTSALNTLLSQIASGTASAGTVVDGAGYNSSTSSFSFSGLIDKSGAPVAGPKAYLNWLVFDKNFVLLNGGYKKMSDVAKEYGQDVAHEYLNSPDINITEPGYVYIYLSNEESSQIEVYFDDLKVTQVKSPVIQQADYYAFGLTFNEYSRENSLPNLFQFNGKEKQDELGLNWLDYGARMYMPELGRWGVIDPHAQKYISVNPYNYAFNNPITIVDPDGRDGILYIQVLTDKNGKSSIDKATISAAINKINDVFKKAGIDLKAEAHYGNKIMGKDEFYSRKGADKTDSYLLLGSNEQLVNHADEAVKKGWDERVGQTTYEDENGVHSKTENFGVLNSDNLKHNGVGADGALENYKGTVDKTSTITMHEDGHSKFDDHPSADRGGHVPGTIMDQNPGTGAKHDNWMIQRLKKIHGTTTTNPK